MKTDFVPRYGQYTEYEKKIIADRTSDLREVYQAFKKEVASRQGGEDVGFALSVPEFLKIPLMYVNDLKEYKTFHDASGGTDTFKRAAYIARLVAMIRPIHVKNDIHVSENLLSVNAQFALYVFLAYAGYSDSAISRSAFEKLSQELLYVFQFRDPQKELLVLIARLLSRASAD